MRGVNKVWAHHSQRRKASPVSEVDELEQPRVVVGPQLKPGGTQQEVPQGPGVRVFGHPADPACRASRGRADFGARGTTLFRRLFGSPDPSVGGLSVL